MTMIKTTMKTSRHKCMRMSYQKKILDRTLAVASGHSTGTFSLSSIMPLASTPSIRVPIYTDDFLSCSIVYKPVHRLQSFEYIVPHVVQGSRAHIEMIALLLLNPVSQYHSHQ